MKKTIFTLLTLAFLGLNITNAQVGIGTDDPDPSAILEVDVSSLTEKKGFLPPRMDTDARNNINNPTEGLTIYNTENNCLEFWNDNYWASVCDSSAQPGSTADCATPSFIPPYLTADQTEIVDVTNPVTGDTWMDRNLGAYTADRSTPGPAGGTDCWAYGNLYQWGRTNDGHEDRTSNIAAGPVAAGDEESDFITSSGDWLLTSDDTRWGNPSDTDKGIHDPCPAGYRVPTEAELVDERSSWSSDDREGAITSPLKLPVAGVRLRGDGELADDGVWGYYWSSTVSSTSARRLDFGNPAYIGTSVRAGGYSVRCIKE